jgi:hypothetical protein
MEIVLQGPLDDFAMHIAEQYTQACFVKRVIISCWENDPNIRTENNKIEIVRSKDLKNPGIGNRNRQIETSLVGLNLVEDEICAKMRTDQEVLPDALAMMEDFFQQFKEPELKYSDGSGPLGKVFVTSLFLAYPFHPRDHIFWGYTKDLKQVFDIPHCKLEPYPSSYDGQYVYHTRAETYICSHYYAKFDSRIKEFVAHPELYLIDKSERVQEALALYYDLREKVFKTFPPIDMKWSKRGFGPYFYHYGPHGEIWHNSYDWNTRAPANQWR